MDVCMNKNIDERSSGSVVIVLSYKLECQLALTGQGAQRLKGSTI
jgi:hypothetical protein